MRKLRRDPVCTVSLFPDLVCSENYTGNLINPVCVCVCPDPLLKMNTLKIFGYTYPEYIKS